MTGSFTFPFRRQRVSGAPHSVRNAAGRQRIAVAGAALLAAALLAGCNENSPPAAAADPLTSSPPDVTPAYPVSASIHDGSGQQTGWRAFLYSSSNGRLARVVTYDGPGADAQWETADDTVAYWSGCAFTGTGWERYNLAIEYSNAPLAAATRAAWDALAPREVQCRLGMRSGDIFFEEAAEDIYVGAGPDLNWFSSDDVPDVYRYTARQGLTPTSSFSWTPTGAAGSAGSRTFWYARGSSGPLHVRESSNGVEELNASFVWGTGLHGNRYTLRDAGDDDVLNNADDTVYLTVTSLYGFDGSTLYRYFDGAGDEAGYLREKRASTEISSQLESVTTATGAGTDGVWETDDDVRTELRYRY